MMMVSSAAYGAGSVLYDPTSDPRLGRLLKLRDLTAPAPLAASVPGRVGLLPLFCFSAFSLTLSSLS